MVTFLFHRKFDQVPLVSKSWSHRRTNGDHFVINSHGTNPSVLKEDQSFEELNLSEAIVQNLMGMGLAKPTQIQRLSTNPILRGRNCVIAAETGSGKTISYLAPIIQMILNHKNDPTLERESRPPLNSPLALIITPGRELCEQLAGVCKSLTQNLPIQSHCLTGGRLKRDMMNSEVQEMDILFATLGAICKFTSSRIYQMDRIKHLVLDEADTLLDDSFNEQLIRFLRKLPLKIDHAEEERTIGVQTVMASATIPRSAEEILSQIIPYSSFEKITTQYVHRLLPHVPQKFIRISHLDKPARLLELVKKDVTRNLPVIVFTNRSERCDWVSMFLNENGISCVNLNGNMSHRLRLGRFNDFQSGKHMVLSCTDVVSRGLDTAHAHHVINYDVPTNISDYIHRCGRIGRVGSRTPNGIVTTMVSHPAEADLVHKIEYAARKTHAEELPNVNANIKRLITNQVLKKSALSP